MYTHLKYTVKLPYKCIQIRQSNKYRKLLLQKSQQCLFLSMYSFLCLSLGPFQIYLQFWFLLFAIEERRPFCLDIRRGGLLEGARKQKKINNQKSDRHTPHQGQLQIGGHREVRTKSQKLDFFILQRHSAGLVKQVLNVTDHCWRSCQLFYCY